MLRCFKLFVVKDIEDRYRFTVYWIFSSLNIRSGRNRFFWQKPNPDKITDCIKESYLNHLLLGGRWQAEGSIGTHHVSMRWHVG